MIIQVGDVSVDLIEDGDRICLGLRAGKKWEPESRAVWSTLCAKGGTALDIGAYTGVYAIAAAKLGCASFAFECLPGNADRLQRNAVANDAHVALVRSAVSDFNGRTSFSFNPKVPFTSGGSLLGNKHPAISVNVCTIDSMDFDNVTAMKIDVEHNEPAVLRGAAKTIARCKPAIILEVLDDKGRAGVRAALPGYKVARELDTRNWLMMPEC